MNKRVDTITQERKSKSKRVKAHRKRRKKISTSININIKNKNKNKNTIIRTQAKQGKKKKTEHRKNTEKRTQSGASPKPSKHENNKRHSRHTGTQQVRTQNMSNSIAKPSHVRTTVGSCQDCSTTEELPNTFASDGYCILLYVSPLDCVWGRRLQWMMPNLS